MADTVRDLMAESPAKVQPSDSVEDAALADISDAAPNN
jgi:hypothetical protein